MSKPQWADNVIRDYKDRITDLERKLAEAQKIIQGARIFISPAVLGGKAWHKAADDYSEAASTESQ